jgi:hypothetical protein
MILVIVGSSKCCHIRKNPIIFVSAVSVFGLDIFQQKEVSLSQSTSNLAREMENAGFKHVQ